MQGRTIFRSSEESSLNGSRTKTLVDLSTSAMWPSAKAVSMRDWSSDLDGIEFIASGKSQCLRGKRSYEPKVLVAVEVGCLESTTVRQYWGALVNRDMKLWQDLLNLLLHVSDLLVSDASEDGGVRDRGSASAIKERVVQGIGQN